MTATDPMTTRRVPRAIACLLVLAPAWTMAGPFMVYGGRDITVYDLATGRHTKLMDDPAKDIQPDWSRDGNQIVFLSNRNGAWDVYTMDAAGRNIQQRTDTPERESKPVFSPNGRYVAYTLHIEGLAGLNDPTPVLILDLETGTEKSIAADVGVFELEVSWFPDSDHVLYGRGFGHGFEVVKVNIHDGGEEFVRRAIAPALSRDGLSIAARAGLDDKTHVYLYDVEARTREKTAVLLPAPNWPVTLRWTNDGGHIYITDGEGDQFLADIQTGDVEALPVQGFWVGWYDPAHPWDVSARGMQPFTWGWLKSMGHVRPGPRAE